MDLLFWTLIAVFLLFSSHRQLNQVTSLESVSGSSGPPLKSMDLLAAMGLSNTTWNGISLAPGYLRGKPAYQLEGSRNNLMLPSDAFREVGSLLRKGSEFTIGVWLRQEIGNTGTIFSVSNNATAFLEIQSSGRRNEIRFHYKSLKDKSVHTEVFHYRLADNTWHHLAVSISGLQIEVLIDCHPLYKNVLIHGQPDRNITDHHQIWIGQRFNHYFFKGFLQDLRLIGGSHGVLAVCPKLDVSCPTCGEFLNVRNVVQDLERKVLELSQRLAHAEMRITIIEDCDCQKSCKTNDTIHDDGSTWQTECKVCSCKSGKISCNPIKCPPTDCKHPVLLEGECCQSCLKQCFFNQRFFDHEEVTSGGKCKECKCLDGTMSCEVMDPIDCPVLKCAPEQQLLEVNSCCPICQGVDYCAMGDFCHTNATCRNLQTTHICQCNSGFAGDGKTCTDIDECQQEGGSEGHHCHSNTRCVNTPGSYECQCLDGYIRTDRYNCAELDECSTGTHNCDLNADCVNTEGSYKCQCREGYQGDGYQCSPICNPNCSNGGVCSKPGMCACRAGYMGPSCQLDVDECETNTHRCTNSSTCVNLLGWYYCKCKDGYNGPVNDSNIHGTFCVDINECEESKHSCHSSAKCVNTVGGFECSCPNDSLDCRYSCMEGEREIPHEQTVVSNNDPCQTCTCNKGIMSCEKPKCDCTKSSSDGCCPQCDSRYDCQHQIYDISFKHGESWSFECQNCECLYGEVDCSPLRCPPMMCPNPIKNPEDCCPHCVDLCSMKNYSTSGIDNNCIFKNVMHASGSEFSDSDDPCVTCKCQVPFCAELVSNTACCVHRMDNYVAILIPIAVTLPLWALMDFLLPVAAILSLQLLQIFQQLLIIIIIWLQRFLIVKPEIFLTLSIILRHLKVRPHLRKVRYPYLSLLLKIVPVDLSVIRVIWTLLLNWIRKKVVVLKNSFIVLIIIINTYLQVMKNAADLIKCRHPEAENLQKESPGTTLREIL